MANEGDEALDAVPQAAVEEAAAEGGPEMTPQKSIKSSTAASFSVIGKSMLSRSFEGQASSTSIWDIERQVSSEDEEELETPEHRASEASAFAHVVARQEPNSLQGVLANVISHPNFDLLMGVIIIGNVAVMVYETDQNAPCVGDDTLKCGSMVLDVVNYVFLAVYTVEASMRVFVLRLKVFRSFWNNLDLFVVFAGYLDLGLSSQGTEGSGGPNVSLLRIFRVFRLLRAVRIFQKVPELHAMLRGFLSAMQSMFWGFIMIIVLLVLFSVLCVELIHPISLRVHVDNEYCASAFGSVWHCMLMFFQTLVAGDSWGNCTLPIIKSDWWAFLIFACSLICIQLGFMNLILAVIVERAHQSAQEDENAIREEKLKTEQKATQRLRKLFQIIDADGSGSISLEELLEGFDTNRPMQNMFSRLDLTRTDLEVIFELMDTDNVGELSYESLIENLRMSQLDDTRKSLTMLRLQTAEIGRCCKKLNGAAMSSFEQSPCNASTHSMQSTVSSAADDGSTSQPRPPADSTTAAVEEADSARSTATKADESASESGPSVPSPPRCRSSARRGTRKPSMSEVAFEKQTLDIDVFNREMEALQTQLGCSMSKEMEEMRAYLDAVLAGSRDTVLSTSGQPPHAKEDARLMPASDANGLGPRPMCPHNSLASAADTQADEPSERHIICSADLPPDLRVASLLTDKALRIEQGPGVGEVSL